MIDRIKNLVAAIRYKDWQILVRLDGDRPYLQVQFDAPDADTGNPAQQRGRKWMLSPHMTDTEVVRTAFKACLAAEEHGQRRPGAGMTRESATKGP